MEEGQGKEEKGREGKDEKGGIEKSRLTVRNGHPEITAVNGAASGRAAGRNVMG